MPKPVENLASKGFSIAIGSLLTVVGWYLASLNSTVDGLRDKTAEIEKEQLLLKQRVDFKVEWIQREVMEMKKGKK